MTVYDVVFLLSIRPVRQFDAFLFNLFFDVASIFGVGGPINEDEASDNPCAGAIQ